MTTRFGTDIILSEDGDIVFKSSNDMMSSQDYENQKGDAKFEGYYSVTRAIMNRLLSVPGDYPFDPAYGGELYKWISKPIDQNYTNNIATVVSNELRKDDRVAEVIGVRAEIIQKYFVIISAQVKLIGDDSVSELVFPKMLIS